MYESCHSRTTLAKLEPNESTSKKSTAGGSFFI